MNKLQIERQKIKIDKLKRRELIKNFIVRMSIGLPLIILSQFLKNSHIETKWFSGDILIIVGVLIIIVPYILEGFKKWQKRK